MTSEQEQKLLSLTEAAGLLKVHPNTLRKWSDEGRVSAVRRPGGGGYRRFDPRVIEELREQMGLKD